MILIKMKESLLSLLKLFNKRNTFPIGNCGNPLITRHFSHKEDRQPYFFRSLEIHRITTLLLENIRTFSTRERSCFFYSFL